MKPLQIVEVFFYSEILQVVLIKNYKNEGNS